MLFASLLLIAGMQSSITPQSFNLGQDFNWANAPSLDDVKSRLIENLGQRHKSNIEETTERIGLSFWYGVTLDGNRYIVDQSGSYITKQTDGVINFNSGLPSIVTLTNTEWNSLSNFISFLSGSQSIVTTYQPNIAVKDEVYVFIDLSCEFCRKFHNTELRKLLLDGIAVKYVPYVRSHSKKLERLTSNVFCQPEAIRKHLIDEIYNVGWKKYQPSATQQECNKVNTKELEAIIYSGLRHGLKASPVFINSSGKVFEGYSAYKAAN